MSIGTERLKARYKKRTCLACLPHKYWATSFLPDCTTRSLSPSGFQLCRLPCMYTLGSLGYVYSDLMSRRGRVLPYHISLWVLTFNWSVQWRAVRFAHSFHQYETQKNTQNACFQRCFSIPFTANPRKVVWLAKVGLAVKRFDCVFRTIRL